MLEVVIGLLFVFLLYSLLATTVMELLSGIFSLRGRNLERALRNMLHSENDQIFKSFKENPLYKQLAGRYLGKKSPPSYLSAEKFQSILLKVVEKKEKAEDVKGRIQQLPEGSMKEVLQQLLDDAEENVSVFKYKVEDWFDDMMDRASGWYKRRIKLWLIAMGLIIAAVFNVDTIQVYKSLAEDPQKRMEVARMAEQFVQTRESYNLQVQDSSEYKERMNALLSKNLENLEKPLGIGWDVVDFAQMGPIQWAYKIFGWFIMALAISLGAPFWFDVLKKLVNIRSSGNTPSTQVIYRTPPPSPNDSGKSGGPVG